MKTTTTYTPAQIIAGVVVDLDATIYDSFFTDRHLRNWRACRKAIAALITELAANIDLDHQREAMAHLALAVFMLDGFPKTRRRDDLYRALMAARSALRLLGGREQAA